VSHFHGKSPDKEPKKRSFLTETGVVRHCSHISDESLAGETAQKAEKSKPCTAGFQSGWSDLERLA
jgi:hypothetical protein